MRRGSSISTDASLDANGGNILINANAILQLENSDITANAVQGQGGNIQINTQSVFASADSNITASSERGISGVVNINNLDVKQDDSLKQQTSEFIDIDNLLANSCIAYRNFSQGSFVVTGNGGFAESPNSSYLDYPITQVTPIKSSGITNSYQFSQTKPTWRLGDKVEEATQLISSYDGKKLLVSASNRYFNSVTSLTCARD